MADANFTISDDSDATKQLKFSVGGITTATTRTLTVPDVSDTLVTLAATQTLTNKTLTAPSITAPSIVAGTGAETYVPIGVVEINTTSTATGADTNETDLWTYSLPANTLSANGKALRITVHGIVAATADAKTIRLVVGSNSRIINDVTGSPNNVNWRAEAVVIRTSATELMRFNDSKVGAAVQTHTSTNPIAFDPTAALTIKVTGQNGAATANDIVFRAAIVEYLG